MKKIVFFLMFYASCFFGYSQQSLLEMTKMTKIKTVPYIAMKIYKSNLEVNKKAFNENLDTMFEVRLDSKQIDSLKKVLNSPSISKEIEKLINENKKKYGVIKNLNAQILKNDLASLDSAIFERKNILLDYGKKFNIKNYEYTSEEAMQVYEKDSLTFELYLLLQNYNNQFEKISSSNTDTDSKIKNLIRLKYDTKKDSTEMLDIDKKVGLIKGLIQENDAKFDKLVLEINKNVNPIIEKINKITVNESEENFVSTLPEVISSFGNGVVLPSFNILGNSSFNLNNFRGTIKIYSSASALGKNYDWRTITTPEAGNFGIAVNFTRGFKSDNKKDNNNFALTFKSNYIKRSASDYVIKFDTFTARDKIDTNTVNFSQFHFKPGLEFVIVPDIISLYAEYNKQFTVTGISDLKNTLKDLAEKNLSYFNTGVKFKINPQGIWKAKAKKSYIIFDLNFIWLDKTLKEFGNTKDKVIPILKTGIKI